MSMEPDFVQPIPWGVDGGRSYLPSVSAALGALRARLAASDVPEEEARDIGLLHGLLLGARRNPGTVDFDAMADAFARFVAKWHERNREPA